MDLVEWAHERGKTVNAWTVDTWYQAERLADAGVDGLVADYPNLRWSAGGVENGRETGSEHGGSH